MLRRSALLALLTLALPCLAGSASAQELPARPIRLLVPFTTGGTTDILARILTEHAQAEFGQPLIVESRPGAGGVTGTAHVAAALPDGTTLVMGTPGPIATAPGLMASMPYDPLRDLAPVMLVANVPNLVVVSPASGITSIAGLIAAARARPGAIHFGSAGIGATTHLAGELFKLMTGVDIVHVPCRGSVPALTDLQGRQIQLMFENMPGALELVRAGRLTGLAVTSPTRALAAPEIPKVAERSFETAGTGPLPHPATQRQYPGWVAGWGSGPMPGLRMRLSAHSQTVTEAVPGYAVVSWFAIFTGGAVSAPVVQRLNAGFRRIMARPAVRQRVNELGAEPADGSPEALAALAREETERWGRVIREARITVQ